MIKLTQTSAVGPESTTVSTLRKILEGTLCRFPQLLDSCLLSGFELLIASAPPHFITQRSISHLRRLCVTQFFLQKRIEAALKKKDFQVFTKFFCIESRLCLMTFIAFPDGEQLICQDSLIKSMQAIAPGMSGVPASFWRWVHPELPYMGLYIEMQRLRGKEISSEEIRLLRCTFEQQLLHTLPTQPSSIFWPFNEEEAYKQIQVLKKELTSPSDLPQVVIHFRQLSTTSLEFIIHLVRPGSEHSLLLQAATLPSSVQFCLHFMSKGDSPFSNEACCFSLFLPTRYFNERKTINLLQARDCIVQHLQHMLGPFRDYNGGLFETQKETFGNIASILADKIPHFSLFANKVFHALQPVEARFSLSLDKWEIIFRSIASAISKLSAEAHISKEGDIWVFKTKQHSEIQSLIHQAKHNHLVYVAFEHDSLYFFCALDEMKTHINYLQKSASLASTKKSTLRLAFFDGQPPSLSPYLTGGDVRCRALSKWLFEGLVRLDPSGIPQLAAAERMRISDDKRRYTFFLRPSHWSNGQRVTAHDYSNGWKQVLSRKWASNRPDLLFIIKNGKRLYNRLCTEQELGVRTLDTMTLQIDLEYVDPYFLEKLTQPFFFPALGDSQEPHAFNGPYRVAHYNQHALELEINPYYWDVQKIFFQSIHIDLNSTEAQAWTDFEKGDLDWLGEPFTPLSNTVAQQLRQEGKLVTREVLRPFFLFLNTQHLLLRSREVRQALGLSIDRAYICKGILPNSLPLYNPVPMVKCHTIQENSQKALELFERGVQNLSLSKNNLPTLMFNYIQQTEREPLAKYLQHTWKELFNLSVDIRPQPWNLLRGNLEKKDFHVSGCCVSALYSSPIDWLQGFEEEESFSNFSGWDHPDYRSIVSSIPHVAEDEQTKLIERAASIFAYDSPAIPICSRSIIYAKHAQLKGEVFDSASCVDFRFSFLKE